jgi:hypothetical protein
MTNRTERGPVAHADHDALLIAQYAADDLDPQERAVANQLVDTCPDCAWLAEDLRSIASATAALPALTRPRDFTLTPEQARQLRRGGWRGVVGRLGLGWVRTDIGRTLAAGLTTLGLAGLLIGSIPANINLGFGGSAAASPVGAYVPDSMAESAASPAPSMAAASAPALGSVRGSNPAPSAGGAGAVPGGSNDALVGVSGDRPGGSPKLYGNQPSAGSSTDERLSARDATTGQPANPLVTVSLVSLALGIGLFALRRLGSPSSI